LGKRLWFWAPAVIWVGITFVVSHQPVVHIPFGAPDYVAHGLNYSVLGLLLILALSNGNWRTITPWLLVSAVVLAIVLGIGDEFHQSFVPGRDTEVKDVIADGVGAAVAATGVALLVLALKNQQYRPT
jgi:VanZ family protein